MTPPKIFALRKIDIEDEDGDDDEVDAAKNEATPVRDASTECRPAPSLEVASSRLHQILAVMRGLAHYGAHHKAVFAGGVASALIVVAAKLALPWPLRAVADSWTPCASSGLLAIVPAGFDPVLCMGALFLLLGFVLGFFDMVERVCFARFSLSTVKDMRAEAMAIVMEKRSLHSGDLMTRFLSDSQRVSAGMKNFLVHVFTSTILLLGMTWILFHMAPTLGFIFLGATVMNMVVTGYFARKLFISALRTRAKEGKFANRLFKAIKAAPTEKESDTDDGEDSGESGADVKPVRRKRSTARHTHMQGIATWSAYAIFGVAVLISLWLGSQAVAAGELSKGDMVVFMMYALMLQSPSVKLARQGARSGKIFGSAFRLLQIINSRGGS